MLESLRRLAWAISSSTAEHHEPGLPEREWNDMHGTASSLMKILHAVEFAERRNSSDAGRSGYIPWERETLTRETVLRT